MISFKSKESSKILGYYFLNPGKSHYINELAKVLGLDPMNVYRKLREFENEGIFVSEFRGKQRYYSLAKNNPLLKHYKEIYFKTYGIEKRLKELLEKVRDIKQAFLFGSYTKKKMDDASDIDILVIGEHSALELQRSISKLKKDYGRDFNVVNMSEKEFLSRKKKPDHFLSGILKNKPIKLI